jgi:ribose transport system permease protein
VSEIDVPELAAGAAEAARAEEDAQLEEASEAAGRRSVDRLLNSSPAWMALFLIALIVIFSLLRFSDFVSADNARNILLDASETLVLSVGMTYVIITAGIDLSVGSVLVFASVVAAKVMEAAGGKGWGVVLLGLVAAIVAGGIWGLINGVLVAKARVPALIATLGTLGMALGCALLITGGLDISTLPTTLTNDVGDGRLFGQIPWLVIVALVVTVLSGLVLRFHRFGRRTYAIGSNAEAARRVGIAVDRHLIKVYTFMGLLAGLAGWMDLAHFSTTSVAGHAFDNLSTITAVVLGGTSLFGGIGTMIGTFVGVFIPTILNNGLVIVGVQPFWQQVAVGAILILAVYLDQLRRRAQNRS